jgi:hypothetical protein
MSTAHWVLAAASTLLLSGCTESQAPRLGLTPYFAYTVATVDSNVAFLTGSAAVWDATNPTNGAGHFYVSLADPERSGPVPFDVRATFAANALGPRFASYPRPDTVRLGASPADTIIGTIGTCSGTWYVDSGLFAVREVVDETIVGIVDLWLSQAPPLTGVVRMTGSYVAGRRRP